MNFQGAIGFFAVCMFVLLGVILAIYGGINDKQELVSIGVGIVGPISGAAVRHFFPNIVEAIKSLR